MSNATITRYPRETVEFIAIAVEVDGNPVVDFQYAVTLDGVRPATWSTPTTLGIRKGFLLSASPVGLYTVWVRYTSNPEIPVLEAGQFRVS